MKKSIISVPSVSGFIIGLVGLPLLKILGLLLVCKIILAGGLVYYMVAMSVVAIIALSFVVWDYFYPEKKIIPRKKNENANKFLKGFAVGSMVLFISLLIFVINEMGDLGLSLRDIF